MPEPITSREEVSARAIVSLVFGVLGIVGVCPGPIVAILVGMGEKSGVAKAGVILGWIGLGLYALTAGLILLLVLVGGIAALPFVQ